MGIFLPTFQEKPMGTIFKSQAVWEECWALLGPWRWDR